MFGSLISAVDAVATLSVVIIASVVVVVVVVVVTFW